MGSKFFLALLFLVAFALRSSNFGTSIQFDSDFGRDSLFALRIMRGDWTLLGPQASVGGFYLAPLYYYLIALVYSLTGLVPAAMSVVFISMGAGTILIGYLALKRHVSKLAGIFFVLLSITHPALVMASRSATNQPMMPLVTVLFVTAYLEAVKRQKLVWFALAGLVFGLFFHVHFSALLLLPAIGLLLLMQIQGTIKTKLLSLGAFGCAVLVMISPLILFDVMHGFITSKAFGDYLLASVLGEGIADNHPHLSTLEKVHRIGWFSIQQVWLSFAAFFIVILEVLAHRKEITKKPAYLALTVLSVLTIAALLKYNGYLYDYYLLIPMTIVLMWISTMASLLKAKWFAITLVFAVCIYNWSILRFPFAYRTIPNLSLVTEKIKQDLDSSGEKNFTLFKDSSDQLTGIGYEYRFLLARDGYEPVYEQSYEQADVLYYIQEEGTKDPLISTNWETTQFGATKKELIEDIDAKNWKIKLWRLTK